MNNYHSLDSEMKRIYGKKVYRLALDAGCTCPNRDGTCGYGGCFFCADSSYAESLLPINEQIEKAKEKVAAKINGDGAYIAYFQSHTNTYGDMDRLCGMFREAIDHPRVVILAIGTRPDCLSDQWIERLSELNKIKPVWIELGLQTINDNTAALINRGYNLSVFADAYKRLKKAGLTVIVHVIIGLPGETDEDAEKTVRYLASLQPTLDGIKLHNLNILKGTKLCEMYEENPGLIHEYTMEEYLRLVIKLIDILPEGCIVHRITGDGPRNLLVTPKWITDKKRVQNTFRKMLE